MKRYILSGVLTVMLFASTSQAFTDLQYEIEVETSNQKVEDNFIKSQILFKQANKSGLKTIKALKETLDFIKRVESDPNFRECVAWKTNMLNLDNLADGAKELLGKNQISKMEYDAYISELDQEKNVYLKKINSKQCK